MKRFRSGIAVVVGVVIATSSAAAAAQTVPPRTASLKIIVIAGEDAVNVIQQKTAVAPIVEVLDRNDQPVAGAVVRFAIQGVRASFGGARTLTVATDIAGLAGTTSATQTEPPAAALRLSLRTPRA